MPDLYNPYETYGLRLDEGVCGISGRDLVVTLRGGNPRIEILWEPGFLLGSGYEGIIAVNPEYLLEGEPEILVARIKELLRLS